MAGFLNFRLLVMQRFGSLLINDSIDIQKFEMSLNECMFTLSKIEQASLLIIDARKPPFSILNIV